MKYLAVVAALALSPLQATAQDWGNLDGLLFSHLTNSGTAEASFWLPDHLDPAQAQMAVGVVYEYIPGSAGSTGIAVGLFVRQPQGWAFAGEVSGVFGQSPRDAAFAPGHVDLTTTMPGPNDPRCCPTVPTRWRIDLADMTAEQIQ